MALPRLLDSMVTADPTFSLDPAAQAAASKARQGCLLGAALMILVVSLALEVQSGERIALRGLPDFPLPHTCYSRTLFGVKCPGCGLTRSFILLAHGDWRAAWQMHRLGWLLATIVLFQVPYRIALLAGGERWAFGPRFLACFSNAAIGLLLANWAWQMRLG